MFLANGIPATWASGVAVICFSLVLPGSVNLWEANGRDYRATYAGKGYDYQPKKKPRSLLHYVTRAGLDTLRNASYCEPHLSSRWKMKWIVPVGTRASRCERHLPCGLHGAKEEFFFLPEGQLLQ